MTWMPQTTTLAQCLSLLARQDNLAEQSNFDAAYGCRQNTSSATLNVQDNLAEHDNLDEQSKLADQGNLDRQGNLDAALPKDAIKHLSYDSQSIRPGTLFFCKGAHFMPEYLLQAAEAGATAYVSEVDYSAEFVRAGKAPLPALLVRDIRLALADVAALFYRGLLDTLTLIGFTGTKGKSTTTYMLRAILDSWLGAEGEGNQSAWLSSIENYDGVACTRSSLTTQDVLELYSHFVNAVNSGIRYLTMEVSSQALKYSRTRNLEFEVAGFLNIGEDHISPIEHPHHEDYLASKLEIFKQARTAAVNLESDESERVLQAAACHSRATLTFGFTAEADIIASEVESGARGLSFIVQGPGWRERFTLPMAGQFNVLNALAAIAAASALGVPVKHMQQGLAHCEVSGRMQLVSGPSDKIIIVDYAHNKMSFETIFSTVAREYPERPIVCVFGATGTKGVERRVDLPAVAAQYASKIYITEDDPGEEPLAVINQQIAEVAREAGVAYAIIEDRDAAIACAIEEAPPCSVILVLGKGHETVMRRGREAAPVPSDKERVERILGLHNQQKLDCLGQACGEDFEGGCER